MRRRRWPWVLLVVIASPIALQIYGTRLRAGISADAAAYTAKLAPDLVLQSDQLWREQTRRHRALVSMAASTSATGPGRSSSFQS